MTEQSQIPPNGEDPVLDQQLHVLKRFTPIVGFENRVLARVWRPAPMFWLVFTDYMRRVATPGRRWLAAGMASFGSAIMTVALLNQFVTYSAVAEMQARVATVREVLASGQIAESALNGVQIAAGYVSSIPAASISQWTGVAMGVMLAPVISLVGLYVVMRRPASERVRSYASR